MKLSDAILLGTTTGKVTFDSKGWDTCLIGVGVAALAVSSYPRHEAVVRWPWLNSEFITPPCLIESGGNPARPFNFGMNGPHLGIHIVSGLADRIQEGKITLEDALAWIRSVEPEEASSENVQTDARAKQRVTASEEVSNVSR